MYMLTRITLILWDYCAARTAEPLRTKILQALTIRRTLFYPIKNGRHMVSAGFSGHQEFTDLAVSINSEIVISLRSFSWCFGNLGFAFCISTVHSQQCFRYCLVHSIRLCDYRDPCVLLPICELSDLLN